MKTVCLPILLITVVASTAALLWKTRTPPLAAPAAWSVDDEVSERIDAIAARSLARDAICRELLAQRMTLPEAAAVFGWLDKQPPELEAALMQYNLVKTDLQVVTREEWLLLRTVDCARGVARHDSPDRAAELEAKLDEELGWLWESGEVKVLPAINESGCRLLYERSVAAHEVLSTGSSSPVLASDLPLIARR